MPVTRSRTYLDIGLEDSNNTTGFLFGDEDSNSGENRTAANTSDGFPTLFRSQGFANIVSTISSEFPALEMGCISRPFPTLIPTILTFHKTLGHLAVSFVSWSSASSQNLLLEIFFNSASSPKAARFYLPPSIHWRISPSISGCYWSRRAFFLSGLAFSALHNTILRPVVSIDGKQTRTWSILSVRSSLGRLNCLSSLLLSHSLG